MYVCITYSARYSLDRSIDCPHSELHTIRLVLNHYFGLVATGFRRPSYKSSRQVPNDQNGRNYVITLKRRHRHFLHNRQFKYHNNTVKPPKRRVAGSAEGRRPPTDR